MNLITHLQSLEEQLLDPLTRKDPHALANCLTDDFQEFGSSGRIFSKASVISELSIESPRQLSLDNFQIFPLSPEIVLVTYISTRIAGGETSRFLRSSIWVNLEGGWKIRFHQGTRQADSEEMMK
jgi:hypothetical protein